MPQGTSLPPELAFVHGGLLVSYNARAEPQLVELSIELHARDPGARVPLMVRRLIDDINGGAAGGAEFPPARGSARCVAGPLDTRDPAAGGPAYEYLLEVAGVAPRFLRHMVEVLGMRGTVQGLSLRGESPLDDGPLSVRGADIAAWLRWPRTQLARFAPPFDVREVPWSGTTAFVRAILEEETTHDHLLDFDEALLIFSGCLVTHGLPGGLGRARVALPPGAGRGGRVLAAHWDDFACEGSASDLLVNIMGAFHARVAAIQRLDLGLPG